MAVSCEVVEVVVAASDEVEMLDFAVMAYSKVIVSDQMVGDGGPQLVDSVVATDFVSALAVTTIVETVKAEGGVLSTLREQLVVENISARALLAYFAAAAVEESVVVTDAHAFVANASVVDSVRASNSVVASTQHAVLLSETVVVMDTVVSSELVLVSDVVVVADYAIEEDEYTLVSRVVAKSEVLGTVRISSVVPERVVAFDQVVVRETGLLVESIQVTDKAVGVADLILSDRAKASEYLVPSTVITQLMIADGVATDAISGDSAWLLVDNLYISELQQSTAQVQGLCSIQATVLDSHTEEVVLGFLVSESCRVWPTLHIGIEIRLAEAVVAREYMQVGYDVLVIDEARESHPYVAAVCHNAISALLVEDAMAVGEAVFQDTATGYVEMLVVEDIFVRDRVEVVASLDSFAWVLNSQSLAHSYYDNFVDFNSAVQIGNRVFMLSPTGLFELGGSSDDGVNIQAEVVTGQMDFGTIDRKRIEQIDIGYTSNGDIQAVVSCEGFAPSAPQTLETRTMATAHTSRIRVGKGMVGKYWKMELRNREGADFEMYSIQSKVALSTRRMR